MTRDYGAWLLCALLVMLCANARLARYDIHHRALNLSTTQAYVDGVETLRKLPRATPPLLWQAVAVVAFAVAALYAALLTTSVPEAVPSNRFDPECCSRPPPAR
jgi:hypothetical protein